MSPATSFAAAQTTADSERAARTMNPSTSNTGSLTDVTTKTSEISIEGAKTKQIGKVNCTSTICESYHSIMVGTDNEYFNLEYRLYRGKVAGTIYIIGDTLGRSLKKELVSDKDFKKLVHDQVCSRKMLGSCKMFGQRKKPRMVDLNDVMTEVLPAAMETNEASWISEEIVAQIKTWLLDAQQCGKVRRSQENEAYG